MPIKYEQAYDLRKMAERIVGVLNWYWIDLENVGFLRSYGSSSRGTIARCHALGKAMQMAMGRKGYYLIEVISRRFDKMNFRDQEKVMIHELMHIPKTFGGGFKHHNIVNDKSVNAAYERYLKLKVDKFI